VNREKGIRVREEGQSHFLPALVADDAASRKK